MLFVRNLALKQRKVPEAWGKAIIVPLYKGKESWNECGSCRGIDLLIVSGGELLKLLRCQSYK